MTEQSKVSKEQFEADVKKELLSLIGKNDDRRNSIDEVIDEDRGILDDGYKGYLVGRYEDPKYARSPYQASVYYTAHTYEMM